MNVVERQPAPFPTAAADATKRLFLDAVSLDDPAERRAFVERACAGDEDLRARVGRLLAAHADADELLDAPLLPPVAPEPDGGAIGPYRLVRELGEGGFGVVWEAEQTEPIRRRVALKLLRRDWIGVAAGSRSAGEALARFRAEQQALARLQHAGIARVYDAGVVADGPHAGQPYYAMELVADGEPAPAYCDAKRLDLQARVVLFANIADAVQHAHTRGVLHRDLKPANVLVSAEGNAHPIADTASSGPALPKVIDFGIAKLLDEPVGCDDATLLTTRPGVALGTPLYAAPEQLAGEEADTRSDVFSLGAMLYEVLVGVRPRDGEALRQRSPTANVALPPMSGRLSALSPAEQVALAARRQIAVETFRRELRGELGWIVGKATAAEPERRYQSAAALATDLRRWLSGRPVEAAPQSRLYLARKIVAQHRAAFATAAAAAAAVALGLAAGAAGLIREARAAEESQRQAMLAQAVTAFLTDDLLAAARPSPREGEGRNVTVREVLDVASAELDAAELDPSRAALRDPLVTSAIRKALGDTYVALGYFEIGVVQLKRALALHDSAGRSGDVQRALLLSSLGHALDKAAHPEEAADALHRAAAICESQMSGDDPRRLLVAQRLAAALSRCDRHEEAADVLDRALAALNAAGGSRDPDSLDATRLIRHQRALQLAIAGDLPAVERLYRDQLADTRRLRGSDDLQTLQTQVRLAEYLLAGGDDPAAAAVLLQDAIERLKRVAGPDHPDVIKALSLLASSGES